MSVDFWLGVASTCVFYLMVGMSMGIMIVFTHLAHFFAGSWQIKRMLKHIGIVTLFWPSVILEINTGHGDINQ